MKTNGSANYGFQDTSLNTGTALKYRVIEAEITIVTFHESTLKTRGPKCTVIVIFHLGKQV